ncbi:uncharacterized protein C8Q71DRAFT_682381, partial [Rhodofomes roseus]
WSNNYDTFGSVLRPSRCTGCPRVITANLEQPILKFYCIWRSIYVNEMKDYLMVIHDTCVLSGALLAALARMSLSQKVLLKPAAERDEVLHRNWRVETAANLTAAQLVFGDEVGIDTCNLQQDYSCLHVGHCAVQQYRQARGQRWSMISVIGTEGCIAARPLASMVNALEFFDFIVSDVV